MAVNVNDFNDQLQSDAEKFVNNTYSEENYEEWAARSQEDSASPARGLAKRYGLDEDDLGEYSSRHQQKLQQAIENGDYEAGLMKYAGGDADNAAGEWVEDFVAGLNKGPGGQ